MNPTNKRERVISAVRHSLPHQPPGQARVAIVAVIGRPFEGMPEDNLSAVIQDPSPLLFLDCLSPFHPTWSLITTDQWVCSTIAVGIALQFVSIPHSQSLSLFLSRDPSHEQLVIQEVQALLWVGSIEEIPQDLRGKGFTGTS